MKNYHIYKKNALRNLSEDWDEDTTALDIAYKSDIIEKILLQKFMISHVFEIKDSLRDLLLATNPPRDEEFVRLPFPNIFIDVELKRDYLKKFGIDMEYESITGILLHTAPALTVDMEDYEKEKEYRKLSKKQRIKRSVEDAEKDREKAQRSIWEYSDIEQLSALYLTHGDDGRVGFNHVPLQLEEGSKIIKEAYEIIPKKDNQIVSDFALNIIAFVNTQDVRLVTRDPDRKKNMRRIQKGKFPTPPRTFIKISGATRRYLDKAEDTSSWTYSHRFHVRGHYKIFRSPYYKNKRWQKIWVDGYTKGKGALLEKKYEVSNEDEKDISKGIVKKYA
jgi:hypothetical protein